MNQEKQLEDSEIKIQKGITFVYIGNGSWSKQKEKDGSNPNGKTFYYRQCVCGRLISNCGFAQKHKCV